MSQPATEQQPSRLLRVARYFDPGQDGFVGRMALLGAVGLLVGLCLLGTVLGVAARSEVGRYVIASGLIAAQQNERALEMAEALIEDNPAASWHAYRVKAQALRYLGRYDESLATYDDAMAAFPDDWWPHSHRCFYTALLTGDPSGVMDACDRSIELLPSWQAVAFERRAMARALIGDIDGAAADLEVALEAWDAENADGKRDYEVETRAAWLEALHRGENPITDEVLERELERH